ncbi:hypothetical protein WN943_027536 [Citrus x changshan-huyou]
MLTDGSLQLQQQATTRSLQSSDVVVDLGWAIVSVVDLGWARTRSGRRPVTRSRCRPVTKQVGLGEKKKRRGSAREQEAAVVQGESGNEANGARREKKKRGLSENKKRLSSRGSPVTKQMEGESGNERSKWRGVW